MGTRVPALPNGWQDMCGQERRVCRVCYIESFSLQGPTVSVSMHGVGRHSLRARGIFCISAYDSFFVHVHTTTIFKTNTQTPEPPFLCRAANPPSKTSVRLTSSAKQAQTTPYTQSTLRPSAPQRHSAHRPPRHGARKPGRTRAPRPAPPAPSGPDCTRSSFRGP